MVKSEIIKELLRDEKWRKKLEAAKTTREVEEVIRQFIKLRAGKTHG